MNLYLDTWIWKLSKEYGELWEEKYVKQFQELLPSLPKDCKLFLCPDMSIDVNLYRPMFKDYCLFLYNILKF